MVGHVRAAAFSSRSATVSTGSVSLSLYAIPVRPDCRFDRIDRLAIEGLTPDWLQVLPARDKRMQPFKRELGARAPPGVDHRARAFEGYPRRTPLWRSSVDLRVLSASVF